MRRARVYSAANDPQVSVIDAVRASTSYPFVFQPVAMYDRYLVDGGLSSNLPIFLFEEERRRTNLPVVAFDLIAPSPATSKPYGLRQFCSDMLATALESGQQLLQEVVEGVYYVPVQIPEGIATLDFGLSKAQREHLFDVGRLAAHTFFKKVPQWSQARTPVEQLQALYAAPDLVTPVLRALAREVEDGTPASNVRAQIMLPTERDTRIVAYQYGMDLDPDIDLELAVDGGCTGAAWSSRQPTFADLVEAQGNFSQWKLTQQQQNKVRRDRRAMIAVPMFEPTLAPRALDEFRLLGTLSLDTDTTLRDTLWLTERKDFIVNTASQWAGILSRILR